MKVRVIVAMIGITLVPGSMSGQAVDDRWGAVAQAWDEGHFIAALEGMQALLAGADADRFLEPIALLTGERYETTWIAADGRNPSWGPDGRFLAYEVPTDSGVVTRVVRLGPLSQIVEVRGSKLQFNPTAPEIAFVELVESPGRDQARADAQRDIQPRSRVGFRRLQAEYAIIDAEHSRLRVMNLQTGDETAFTAPGLGVRDVTYGPDGQLYFAAVDHGARGAGDIWILRDGGTTKVTTWPGVKQNPRVVLGGTAIGYMSGSTVYVQDFDSGDVREFSGVDSPVVSADGRIIAFLTGGDDVTDLHVVALDSKTSTDPVTSSTSRIANPSLSSDGSRVAFQMMVRENWEVFVSRADGGDMIQLTSDDQHDLFPTFLPPPSGDTRPEHTVLVIKGEGRHRRSYLYDLETREARRLFHNNTIRTVSPEYTWAVSPDGSKVAIVSERDGDTISPERSLHVVNLEHVLPQGDIERRVQAQLTHEKQLRENGERAFQSIAANVRTVVADVSRTRIYEYEKDLFAFGSKFITQPGNAMAIEYIADKLRSFGYDPELQWFEPRPGVPSANVIATLRGTRDPELVYVISSHFDSVERGPGADDNTSGTTALLEAARVMRDHPMPTTIKFAFFTGEEAGLLGSRYFVREAVANGLQIVGALNNDMVGYANDARLDNTIRYSNAGIRDIQHAAAFLFTDLITYDARYYKSTDAHAYYDAYGDVVGGIGSYPILANPHYHQTHDVLETINHQLVAEVSKTTVASIMLMASSTARLERVTANRSGRHVTVAWSEPAESDIANYVVFVWDENGEVEQIQVYEPEDAEFAARSATLSDVSAAATIGVQASVRGANGVIGSWDWARADVP